MTLQNLFSLSPVAQVFREIYYFRKLQQLQYETCREKTGLRGFRPNPTQTELYSHRRWLEA